jgi:MFS family permease
VKVLESPLFAKVLAEQKTAAPPLFEVLRKHPRNVLLALGARIAENGFYYFFTVFAITYGTQQLELPRSVLIEGVSLAAVASLVSTPLFGALSDRIGRRPVYLGGAVFLGVFAFPFFQLMDTRETGWVFFALAVGMIGHAAMYGPQAAFLSELFGTRVRYTGASLGYQLAAPLSGGLVPLVSLALLARFGGDTRPVSVYLVAMALVTVVAVLLAAETNQLDLEGQER